MELINGRNSSILLEAKDLNFKNEDSWLPKNFFNSAALSPDGKYIAFIGENKFWQVVGFVDITTRKITRISGHLSSEKWLSVEWGPGSRFFIVRGYDTNGGERNVTIFDVQKEGYQVISFMDKLDVSHSTVRHVDIETFKWTKENSLRVEYWYLGKQEKQIFVWNAREFGRDP